MFNILTTPSIFQIDRKNYGQWEEERRSRERERMSSIWDQDRSDLLLEHRRVVVTQRVEGSGGVLRSGEVPTRRRHEPTMPAPSRNLGVTRTIVGLGVALARSGEVPSRGRHNSSVPTRSDGRGVVLAESGEVPTRGRHNSSVPTRSDGRGVVLAESGEVPTRAVTIRPCPPGAMEGVWYWRRVERSLPGAVTCPPGVNFRIGEIRSSGTSELYPGTYDKKKYTASHVPTARSWGPFLTSDGTSTTIMSLGM